MFSIQVRSSNLELLNLSSYNTYEEYNLEWIILVGGGAPAGIQDFIKDQLDGLEELYDEAAIQAGINIHDDYDEDDDDHDDDDHDDDEHDDHDHDEDDNENVEQWQDWAEDWFTPWDYWGEDEDDDHDEFFDDDLKQVFEDFYDKIDAQIDDFLDQFGDKADFLPDWNFDGFDYDWDDYSLDWFDQLGNVTGKLFWFFFCIDDSSKPTSRLVWKWLRQMDRASRYVVWQQQGRRPRQRRRPRRER